jgi:hypothetical protein
MKMQVYINWKEIRPDGSFGREIEHELHSYTVGFFKILMAHFVQGSIANCKDTGGVNQTISGLSSNFDITAALGVVTRGIVVGTGNNAPTIDDYVLQTLILHGATAGKLNYAALVKNTTAVNSPAGTWYFLFERQLTNTSGGNITVNEVGLYVNGSGYNIMVDRSLSTFIINNGAGALVTYKISLTV